MINLNNLIDNVPKKNIFITSDNHFFHTQMMYYCNRPFVKDKEGTLLMNEYILSRYDMLPDTKGTVIIDLGDVFYGKLVNFHVDELKQYIKRMKGNNRTLILVLGNHDKELLKFLKIKDKSTSEYFQELGYDYVIEDGIVYNNFILTHEPIFVDSDSNIINIHGHTHKECVNSNYFFSTENALVNPLSYFNVCVDNTDFKFVKFANIIEYEEKVIYNLELSRKLKHVEKMKDDFDREKNCHNSQCYVYEDLILNLEKARQEILVLQEMNKINQKDFY